MNNVIGIITYDPDHRRSNIVDGTSERRRAAGLSRIFDFLFFLQRRHIEEFETLEIQNHTAKIRR